MKEVKRENLHAGKQYYLEGLTYDNNKNMVPCNPAYKMVAIFVKAEAIYSNAEQSNGFKHMFFTDFIKPNAPINSGYDVHLNLLWKFYELEKYDIQNTMEERAYNLYLQQIIGDKWFHW